MSLILLFYYQIFDFVHFMIRGLRLFQCENYHLGPLVDHPMKVLFNLSNLLIRLFQINYFHLADFLRSNRFRYRKLPKLIKFGLDSSPNIQIWRLIMGIRTFMSEHILEFVVFTSGFISTIFKIFIARKLVASD